MIDVDVFRKRLDEAHAAYVKRAVDQAADERQLEALCVLACYEFERGKNGQVIVTDPARGYPTLLTPDEVRAIVAEDVSVPIPTAHAAREEGTPVR